MAKRVSVARKAKDRWKSKVWYSLHAPAMFDYAVMAQTPAGDPAQVPGRVAEVPLQVITGNFAQKNFMLRFQVSEVRGFNAFTRYIGHKLTSDYLRALTRRKHTRVDAIFECITSDDIRIRVKPLVILDRRIQTSQERMIRGIVVERIKAMLGELSLAEGLRLVFSGDLGRELAKHLRLIYPTKRVEVGKLDVLDPSQLMEVPPTEEELERILAGPGDEAFEDDEEGEDAGEEDAAEVAEADDKSDDVQPDAAGTDENAVEPTAEPAVEPATDASTDAEELPAGTPEGDAAPSTKKEPDAGD